MAKSKIQMTDAEVGVPFVRRATQPTTPDTLYMDNSSVLRVTDHTGSGNTAVGSGGGGGITIGEVSSTSILIAPEAQGASPSAGAHVSHLGGVATVTIPYTRLEDAPNSSSDGSVSLIGEEIDITNALPGSLTGKLKKIKGAGGITVSVGTGATAGLITITGSGGGASSAAAVTTTTNSGFLLGVATDLQSVVDRVAAITDRTVTSGTAWLVSAATGNTVGFRCTGSTSTTGAFSSSSNHFGFKHTGSGPTGSNVGFVATQTAIGTSYSNSVMIATSFLGGGASPRIYTTAEVNNMSPGDMFYGSIAGGVVMPGATIFNPAPVDLYLVLRTADSGAGVGDYLKGIGRDSNTNLPL